MSLKEKAKQVFAQELEIMLEEMPLDKIRITSLTKRCGTSPQAFYYHFQDKYELVAWIFLQDFYRIFPTGTSDFSAEKIAQMLDVMNNHKSFYQKAFEDKSQNAIESYIHQFNLTTLSKAVMAYKNRQFLTEEEHLDIIFQSHGVMGIFKDWIYGPLTYDIQLLANYQYQKLPDYLKKAYEHYHFDRLN